MYISNICNIFVYIDNIYFFHWKNISEHSLRVEKWSMVELHDWLEEVKKGEGDNPSFIIGWQEKMVVSFTHLSVGGQIPRK